jgi:hypothetical protein
MSSGVVRDPEAEGRQMEQHCSKVAERIILNRDDCEFQSISFTFIFPHIFTDRFIH